MNRTLRALLLAMSVSVVLAGAVQGKAGGVPAIPLNTGQETDEVISDGSGSFSYTVDGSTLCYVLEVRDLTGAPVAAHIHLGARNVAGGVVVPLATPPGATSSVSACITAAEGGAMTPAELAAIVADPGAYYVNVHTPTYPGGEVRGQLKQARTLVDGPKLASGHRFTAPVAVALGGFSGNYLEWSVPTDIDFDNCDEGFFESWTANGWARDRYLQEPGQVDRLWILDVDGERLVIDATYVPGATDQDRAELESVVDSIRFLDE